jgi:transcriptional regulator with XRE-family HTH domain
MFYEKLKNLCFEQGISVSKMAVDLKISTTTVTGWKRGARPQPAQVRKIAEYFKFSTDELMRETPVAAPSGAPDEKAGLMEIIKSQQEAIRSLSESNKNLSEYLSKGRRIIQHSRR